MQTPEHIIQVRVSPSERETGALERWSTNQDGERSTRGHLTWHSFKGKEVSEGGWLVTGIGCANDTQTHRVWIEPVITLSFFFFFLSTAMGVYALTAERWWETTVQNRVDISTAWCPMNCTIPTRRHLSMRLSYKLRWNTSVPKAWDTELHRKRSSDLRLGLQEFFFFFPKLVFKALGFR